MFFPETGAFFRLECGRHREHYFDKILDKTDYLKFFTNLSKAILKYKYNIYFAIT